MATQGFHPKLVLLTETGETASWLVALVSGVVSALLLWPVAAVLRRIPRGTLIDVWEAALGRPGGYAVGLLFTAIIVFANGLIIRETAEMTITAVFPHTPQTLLVLALAAGATFIAWGDGPHLVRTGRMMMPMLLVALALVLGGTIGWGEWRYLLPFWGPGLPQLVAGLPGVTAILSPVLALTTLTDHVDDRAGLVRWLPTAALVGGGILAAIQGVLLMVFSYPIGTGIPFPLHTAARLVLGGRFFERLEGVWVFVWTAATIVMLGTLLYAGSQLYTRAFRIPRRQMAIIPLATIMMACAYFPIDHAQTIQVHLTLTTPLFYVIFGIPAVLALIAHVRLGRAGG